MNDAIYKTEIHSREVTRIVDYSEMDSKDRQLFFKAYKFNRYTETYHLVDEESLKKISNKEKLLLD